MTADADAHPLSVTSRGWRQVVCPIWRGFLDFALVLWVVRVPFVLTVFGLLLLAGTPQTQDLLVGLVDPDPGDRTVWLDPSVWWFLVLLMFVWAMPTHYAARLLLDTDTRFRNVVAARAAAGKAGWIGAVERWVPRLLGLLTFMAMLVAIRRSYANLPDLDEDRVIDLLQAKLGNLAWMVGAAGLVFFIYVVGRRRMMGVVHLKWLAVINRPLTRLWRTISPGLADPVGSKDEVDRNVGRFLLAAVFVLFVLILLIDADQVAVHFPRALAIPLILGGWLPFLSYLSGLGRAWRAPLITGLVAVVALLTALIGDNHMVRRVDAAAGSNEPSRIRLDDAVRLWMNENGCGGRPDACPRPVIVAATGGASRAGFFTASVLGYFMQEAPAHGLEARDVRNRLFAFSGVSGGSVGAVMVTAALAAGVDQHPCTSDRFDLWWGEKIGNWRDCFEALTSGDFLTPVFLGFMFRDMVRFGWWNDRAALLEQSFEQRFAQALRGGSVELEEPFLSIRPRQGRWIPLLVLNGASEATGTRLVTTALAPTYRSIRKPTAPVKPEDCPTVIRASPEGTECVLFAEADHIHDLLNGPATPNVGSATAPAGVLSIDVRASTAAHNSARFPIISPPGSVLARDRRIVDRIVDGGYVENYGATSALELARAIRAVEPKLAPFVLVISNDPDDLIDPADEVDPPQASPGATEPRRARPAVDGHEFFTEVIAPITTFANTRTARGVLAVAQMRSVLQQTLPGCEHVAHVRVWPQAAEQQERSRAVSMSWWLSIPIQRHLHQQTEERTPEIIARLSARRNGVPPPPAEGMNANHNRERLNMAWRALAPQSTCIPPPER